MSNHLHFQASSRDADLLSRFESHVLGNTARVAKELTGWKGPVWERCQPIPILDNLAAEQRLSYILANGTKEGLVSSPLEWPGACAAQALYSGEALVGEFPIRRAGFVVKVETYAITLTPLPSWTGFSSAQRVERARAIIEQIITDAKRARGGRPPLGIDGILSTDPFATVDLDRRAPPLCHATDDLVRDEFLVARRVFLGEHARASEKHRRVPSEAAFPPHAFTPPSYRE